MRLLLLSDVHVEFQADGGRTFVESLDPTGVEVLVLAGDIAVGEGIPDALSLFCERFDRAEVIYIHGNHEYYGLSRDAVIDGTRRAVANHHNLTWLDAESRMIAGRRFIGGTLWFSRDPSLDPYKPQAPDFVHIPNFEPWVYAQNDRMRRLLSAELAEGDIVVTHHLPTRRSITPQYRDSPFTPLFLCDLEPLMAERAPALWLHGHTHDSVDVTVGRTRVCCNPFGYVGLELNRGFRPRPFIEL